MTDEARLAAIAEHLDLCERCRHAVGWPSAAPWLNVLGSRHFADWLAQQHISVAFTTYQAGKLLGCKPDRRLAVFEWTLERCMGL